MRPKIRLFASLSDHGDVTSLPGLMIDRVILFSIRLDPLYGYLAADSPVSL
jgi:hypothetical protein